MNRSQLVRLNLLYIRNEIWRRFLSLFVNFVILKRLFYSSDMEFLYRISLSIICNFKLFFNLLSAKPTQWSNTLKQFFGNSRRIVWVCLTIFQVGALKCYLKKFLVRHYSASINLTQQYISISLPNSPRHLATANITAEVLHTFHCFMFFTSNDFD